MTVPRDKETLDLIRRFRTEGARRRKTYIVAASLAGAAFLAFLIAVVVLTLPDSRGQTASGSSTSLSLAAVTPASTQSTTTTMTADTAGAVLGAVTTTDTTASPARKL